MDCRVTINNTSGFLQMLRSEFEAGRKVNFLIDSSGLERLEGVITSIEENAVCRVNLDSGRSVELSHIVAVNGVFVSDYSEC